MGRGSRSRVRGAIQRRLAGDPGATTTEYLGVVLAVVAVVLALLLASPGLSASVTTGIRNAVCAVTGEGCAGAGGQLAGTPSRPSVVCDLATDSSSYGGKITVVVVSAEGELGYTITERSDEQYDVTLIGSGGIGLELIAGTSLDLGGAGVGGSGAVGVSGNGEIATTYRFGSEAEARAFIDHTKRVMSRTFGGGVRGVTGVISRNPLQTVLGIRDVVRGMRGWDPPPPTAVRVEGSVSLAADGKAGGGAGKVAGALEAGTALGTDIDLEDGTSTVYVRVDHEAAVAAGLLPVANANAGLGGDVTLALTVRHSDLRPVQLAVAHTVELSGNIDIPAVTAGMALAGSDTAGLTRALGEATGLLEHKDTASVHSSAVFDLTNPADEALASAVLTGLATRSPIDIGRAGGEVARHIADNTSVEVEVWSGSQDKWGFEGRTGAGAGGGLSVARTTASERLLAAVDRPARGGFLPRNCGDGL